MSDLTRTRDHFRRMADGGHLPDCWAAMPREWRRHWVTTAPADDVAAVARGQVTAPEPPCTCATDADRVLFAQLAGEIDAYLAGDPDVVTTPTPDDVPLEGL